MNPYPAPSSITMQRPGESPVNITLEDAVVIMTNQQKTIEDLIRNNQKMYQYIQEMQGGGGGYGAASNVQFMQQNVGDPASHLSNSFGSGAGAGAPMASSKPMTLSEYLAAKKAGGTKEAPAAAKPMTLSEYLAAKKAASSASSKTESAAASSSKTESASASSSKTESASAVPKEAVDEIPVFEEASKSEPEVIDFNA